MIKFAYIYAMPGLDKPQFTEFKTAQAHFYAIAVNLKTPEDAIDVAEQLFKQQQINMIELCGGLANANLVSQVKQVVGPKVAVGQVMYGPEYRQTLVDIINQSQ